MKPLVVALCIALEATVSFGQSMPSELYAPVQRNPWQDDLPEFEVAVHMLAKTLYDPSPNVRQAAVMALQEMGWAAKAALPGRSCSSETCRTSGRRWRSLIYAS